MRLLAFGVGASGLSGSALFLLPLLALWLGAGYVAAAGISRASLLRVVAYGSALFYLVGVALVVWLATERSDFEYIGYTIFPADAPREAELSMDGLRLRLLAADGERAAVSEPALVVSRQSESAFGTGRAGMQYRDLIPGRFGGRFIASHIRIPTGGPVPDYVHHHDVEFQMIFCVNGWVRVAYEDQGEPMRMEAGSSLP